MRAEDACEIDGRLHWTGDDKVEGEEDPGVVGRGDVDDVDVDGGGWMETGPTVGYCDLECGEEERVGSDQAGEGLMSVSFPEMKKITKTNDKRESSEDWKTNSCNREGYRDGYVGDRNHSEYIDSIQSIYSH